jgi:hypothetical protein
VVYFERESRGITRVIKAASPNTPRALPLPRRDGTRAIKQRFILGSTVGAGRTGQGARVNGGKESRGHVDGAERPASASAPSKEGAQNPPRRSSPRAQQLRPASSAPLSPQHPRHSFPASNPTTYQLDCACALLRTPPAAPQSRPAHSRPPSSSSSRPVPRAHLRPLLCPCPSRGRGPARGAACGGGGVLPLLCVGNHQRGQDVRPAPAAVRARGGVRDGGAAWSFRADERRDGESARAAGSRDGGTALEAPPAACAPRARARRAHEPLCSLSPPDRSIHLTPPPRSHPPTQPPPTQTKHSSPSTA